MRNPASGRFDQRTDFDGTGPVRDVLDFAFVAEQVVGELCLERVDHPSREVVPQERDHGSKRFLGGESPAADGMDMGPVDQRSHKRELIGQQGDVAEGAVGALLACGLEPKGYSQMLHLGSQVLEPGSDQIE